MKCSLSCSRNPAMGQMIDKVTSLLGTITPVFERAVDIQRKGVREKERREKEEKRKREEERKRKEEEERKKREEAKRLREEERIIKEAKRQEEYERGTNWLTFIGEENCEYLHDWSQNPSDLKSFSFLNNGCIFVCDDGVCGWRGLPNGRLRSLLNGRGRGMTDKVDLLSVVENYEGELYYYVRFMDGRSYWSLPYYSHSLESFLAKYDIANISLGLFVVLGSKEGGIRVLLGAMERLLFGMGLSITTLFFLEINMQR